MKKVAFKTLGCRLNLFETDAIASELSKKDFEIVDFSEKADVYIVNTCTVTNQSDKKSKQVLNGIKRKHPNALKIVTGCMATNYKESLQQSDTVDYVLLNKIVKDEMAIRSKLLEHVGKRIIDSILNTITEVTKVSVTVAKQNPPIGGDVESVSVTCKAKR